VGTSGWPLVGVYAVRVDKGSARFKRIFFS
jgi:hypothetical protein